MKEEISIIVTTIKQPTVVIRIHDDYCRDASETTERATEIISESYKRRAAARYGVSNKTELPMPQA